jgi:hypothetical protein
MTNFEKAKKQAVYKLTLKSNGWTVDLLASNFSGEDSRSAQIDDYVDSDVEYEVKLLSRKEEKSLRSIGLAAANHEDGRTFDLHYLGVKHEESIAEQLRACEWCPVRKLLEDVTESNGQFPKVGENCRSVQDGHCAIADFAVGKLVNNTQGK